MNTARPVVHMDAEEPAARSACFFSSCDSPRFARFFVLRVCFARSARFFFRCMVCFARFFFGCVVCFARFFFGVLCVSLAPLASFSGVCYVSLAPLASFSGVW